MCIESVSQFVDQIATNSNDYIYVFEVYGNPIRIVAMLYDQTGKTGSGKPKYGCPMPLNF